MLTAKADVSDEIKETLKSIKKINVVFLKKTEDNTVAYEAEKALLKNIFNCFQFCFVVFVFSILFIVFVCFLIIPQYKNTLYLN